jgi:hypothetical protein
MLIDLNTVAHEGDGEPLPDLNAAPTSINLQSIPSAAMLLDLNIDLGEGSEEALDELHWVRYVIRYDMLEEQFTVKKAAPEYSICYGKRACPLDFAE